MVGEYKKIWGTAWAIFSALGLIASVSSSLVLVKHAFDVGFVDPIRLVLDEYQFWVHAFFGWWAEPFLNWLLAHLTTWMKLDLHLSQEWQHVFLIMWLYFAAGARVDKYRHRETSMLFTMVWGGLVALITAVAFGALPFDDPSGKVSSAAIPIAGLVVYELGRRVWAATYLRSSDQSWPESFYIGVRSFVFPIALVGVMMLLVSLMLLELSVIGDTPSPGLVTLFIFILGASAMLFGRGLIRIFYDREPGERRVARFNRSGSGRMSFYVFTVMIAVAMFLVANAGVKLLADL